MGAFLFIFLIILVAYFLSVKSKPKTKLKYTPEKWKPILLQKVNFYRNLNEQGRLQFESDIQQFFSRVRITGVETDVTLEDRLLVASSAVITLFGFPGWNYQYLDEVILFPRSFDRDLKIGSKKEFITGMVGSGIMEGKMILSKRSLHAGFDNAADKKNVGIHEFIHIFDKEDGIIDGVPPILNDKKYTLPWLEFIKEKTNDIIGKKSDIDSYATYHAKEFFAVAGEYFFERPHLLKQKHPKLYEILCEVFRLDMTAIIDKSSFSRRKEIGRNDPCACGSGLKFKKCCAK